MGQVTVRVGGYSHPVSCEDGQEAHLESLARHLDGRIGEMRKAFGEIGDLRLVVMAAITITDEFFEARRQQQGIASEISDIKASQTNVAASLGAREQEIATAIDRMTQRLDRITALLAQRPDI